jgi:hypothetical protein
VDCSLGVDAAIKLPLLDDSTLTQLSEQCRETAFGRSFVVDIALTQPPREGGMLGLRSNAGGVPMYTVKSRAFVLLTGVSLLGLFWGLLIYAMPD